MITYALLVTALLFGGMTLYSFAFAAFLFTALPVDTASALIRKAFPHFYAFVLVTAAIAAFASFSTDTMLSFSGSTRTSTFVEGPPTSVNSALCPGSPTRP